LQNFLANESPPPFDLFARRKPGDAPLSFGQKLKRGLVERIGQHPARVCNASEDIEVFSRSIG